MLSLLEEASPDAEGVLFSTYEENSVPLSVWSGPECEVKVPPLAWNVGLLALAGGAYRTRSASTFRAPFTEGLFEGFQLSVGELDVR